jgi:undecaprenyl-diphosphatase
MNVEAVVDAVLLGVIEGLTEFLPVSSTAHLLLASKLLGFDSAGKAFEVLIQLGAILALLGVYATRLWQILVEFPSDPRTRRFVLGVLAACLPALIVGALFHDFITGVLFNAPIAICLMLILGGIVLLWIDRVPLPQRYTDIMDYPMRVYVGIGLFQCLSVMPGVSRAGATIVGALLLGTDKRSAAEFSFFLAMPIILAAFVFDLYKNLGTIDLGQGSLIAIGFAAAFVSALIVVRTFLGFVSRHGFALFGWWRIIVGAVGLAALLTFGS